MKKQLIGLAAAALMLFGVAVAQASPIQWTIAAGGNNHWYDYVALPGTWDNANTDVQTKQYNGLDGHLVTLTSAAENTFVWDSFSLSFTHTYNAWLGGYQQPGASTPASNWAWVTGEEWSYTNWNTGEPNDGTTGENSQEDHIHFRFSGNWNDLYDTQVIDGYVVEYESSPVPVPTTILLFGIGLLGLAGMNRRKK